MDLETAKRQALGGPIGALAQGALFGTMFLGLSQASRRFDGDHVLSVAAFTLLAATAILVNARWVVPVWRGKPLRESVLLFGMTWASTVLLSGLGHLPGI